MGRRLFDVSERPAYQTTGQILQDLTFFDPQFVKWIDTLARHVLARHEAANELPLLRGKHHPRGCGSEPHRRKTARKGGRRWTHQTI